MAERSGLNPEIKSAHVLAPVTRSMLEILMEASVANLGLQ